MSKERLIIFLRNPELGEVKTRLAQTAGDEKALEVYQKLMSHTMEVVNDWSGRKVLYFTKAVLPSDKTSYKYSKKTQTAGDLGQKMKGAIETELKSYDKVCVIGSDCPELSKGILEEAFQALDIMDVVVGPAKDGGYYLIGMKKVVPELFEDIEWGTSNVMNATLNQITRLGLSFHLLEELSDVDTEKDWKKLKHLVEEKVS